MNAATQGDKAAGVSDWPSAIKHYTKALLENPRAPSYYIKRSTAFGRRKADHGGPDLQAALQDIELALALARERAKRELIIEAQLRRAIVLFQMERFGDAGYLFDLLEEKIGKKDSGDKSAQVQAAMGAQKGSQQKLENELSIWRLKIKAKISKLQDGDEKLAVTVTEAPNIKIPSEDELRKRLKSEFSSASQGGEVEKSTENNLESKPGVSSSASTTAANVSAPVASPAKVRHEWYQSQDFVVITIYAKNIDKSQLETDLQGKSLSLDFPLPSGSTYSFNLEPLFAPIVPAQSKVNVLSTKIEIYLRKQIVGQKWGGLEGSTTASVISNPTTTSTNDPTTASVSVSGPTQTSSTATSGPAYPTSSKHGVKNWDKLADDLTAKKKKKDDSTKQQQTGGPAENDADQAGSGDEDDDADSIDSEFGGGDAVDSFFKKLYAGSDPDTRRAMMKSFYESQGTALSTNWEEVGNQKVPVHPPSDD